MNTAADTTLLHWSLHLLLAYDTVSTNRRGFSR